MCLIQKLLTIQYQNFGYKNYSLLIDHSCLEEEIILFRISVELEYPFEPNLGNLITLMFGNPLFSNSFFNFSSLIH